MESRFKGRRDEDGSPLLPYAAGILDGTLPGLGSRRKVICDLRQADLLPRPFCDSVDSETSWLIKPYRKSEGGWESNPLPW